MYFVLDVTAKRRIERPSCSRGGDGKQKVRSEQTPEKETEINAKRIQRKSSHPIAANFFPLDLLPRDGQLPPQRLKFALAQSGEASIQLLVVFVFSSSDIFGNCDCRCR